MSRDTRLDSRLQNFITSIAGPPEHSETKDAERMDEIQEAPSGTVSSSDSDIRSASPASSTIDTAETLAAYSYLNGSVQLTQLDSGAFPKYAGSIPGVDHEAFRQASNLAFDKISIKSKEFKRELGTVNPVHTATGSSTDFYARLTVHLSRKYSVTRKEIIQEGQPPLRTYQFSSAHTAAQPMWEDMLSDQLDIAYEAAKECGANETTFNNIQNHIRQKILNGINSYKEAKALVQELHGYMLWAVQQTNTDTSAKKNKKAYKKALQTVHTGPHNCDLAVYVEATEEIYFYQRHFELTSAQQPAQSTEVINPLIKPEEKKEKATSPTLAEETATPTASVMPTSHDRTGETLGLSNLARLTVYQKSEDDSTFNVSRTEYRHGSLPPYKCKNLFQRDKIASDNLQQLIQVIQQPAESASEDGAEETKSESSRHVSLCNMSLLTTRFSESTQFESAFLAFYGLTEASLFFDLPLNFNGRRMPVKTSLQDHVNRIGFLRLAMMIMARYQLNTEANSTYTKLSGEIDTLLSQHDKALREAAQQYFDLSNGKDRGANRHAALHAYEAYVEPSQKLRNEVVEKFLDEMPRLSKETGDNQDILALFRYCLELYDPAFNRWKNAHYAGKLQAALSLLAEKLGFVISYNCKSGNDRTGEMTRLRAEFYLHDALARERRKVKELSLNDLHTYAYALIPIFFAISTIVFSAETDFSKDLLVQHALTYAAIALLAIYLIIQANNLYHAIRHVKSRNRTETKLFNSVQIIAASLDIIGSGAMITFVFIGAFSTPLLNLFPSGCLMLALAIGLGLGIYQSIKICQNPEAKEKIKSVIFNIFPTTLTLVAVTLCFFPPAAQALGFDHILPNDHAALTTHAWAIIAPIAILLIAYVIYHLCSKKAPVEKPVEKT